MTISLRPYQHAIVERVNAAYESGARAVCMQLGCGGGKTATASELLRRATALGYRSLFVAHLDTLIEDTHERLDRAGIRAGFVQAGRPSDPSAPVQVASLQTLHVRGDRPPADFVIIDECHRAAAPSVRALLESYPHAAILGLTATPQRADGRALDVFEQLVCGPTNRELTAAGFLVPCHLLAPAGVSKELTGHPVDAYEKSARGRTALVFAANVPHARVIAASFVARGYGADVLTGETPRAKRRELRSAMRDGGLDALVGVGVFLEGWDEPSVDTIILARRFQATGSYLQAIGRGLRPCASTSKSECVVIDLHGSVLLHGLPVEDRVWSLNGLACRSAESSIVLRRCTDCSAIFQQATSCPRCGSRATKAPKIPRVKTRAEKLERFDALTEVERDRRYLRQLFTVASLRMHLSQPRAESWALAQFRRRWGRDPNTNGERAA